jgi:hypothetical protein
VVLRGYLLFVWFVLKNMTNVIFCRVKHSFAQYMGHEEDKETAYEKGEEASPTSVGDDAQR